MLFTVLPPPRLKLFRGFEKKDSEEHIFTTRSRVLRDEE